MKNIFLIILLLANTAISAQRGGGGMGRGQQQNQNGQQNSEREVKQFKASDVAGIFYYDVEEVIKKVKVKDDALKASASKVLRDYNFKIKEIALLNTDNFKAIDILMKSNRGNNKGPRQRNVSNNNENQQPKEVDSLRIKVNKIIRPIRREVNKNEAVLNETLQSILSKKQHTKWLKYQENKKEELAPKKPERNNNRGGQQGQQGQNRQRRF
jgi:hypothetical protein